MEVMARQIFKPALPLLTLALGACSVVGYPGGVSGPLAAASPARPSRVAQAPRTYEVFGVRYTTLASSVDYEEVGLASWYGEEFHGRRTASGETYDMYGLTAAHRTLPLQTCVEVRRLDDDRAVTVRVNDRGPFDDDSRRIIDLSFSAADAIGLIQAGTAEVEVRALDTEQRC